MSENKDIENLLDKFSDNDRHNFQLIHKYIKRKNFSFGSFLHQITGDVYDEKKVLKAISLVISVASSYINELDGYRYNIVQNAMYSNYSHNFIMELITLGTDSKLKNKLNINHVDSDGDTMLHTAIYADDFECDVLKLFKLMLTKGFNYSIVNKQNKNIIEAMKDEQKRIYKFSDEEIEEVEDLFNKIEASKAERERLRIKLGEEENSFRKKVGKLLAEVKVNASDNYKMIESFCSKEVIKVEDFLYCLSTNLYDEIYCFFAITVLVDNGVDITYTPNNGMNSFFQNLIENGYSQKFVFDLLEYCIEKKKMKIDLNYKNQKGDTLVFTAIKSDLYIGNIKDFIQKLKDYGYDVDAKNGDGRTIVEEIETCKKVYKNEEYTDVKQFVESELVEEINQVDYEEAVKELEKYGKVLNAKKYVREPIIGRERELKNLIVTLAQEKKNPIVVGESGVGKTALVEELAYKIKKDEVPKFLKNKIIFQITPSELVAGCKYVGQFEGQMKKVFELAEKYEVILFIDEIHTIYGVGTTEGNNNGLEVMIKSFVDRSGCKVIGTTTNEEYQEYFSHDALKRRLEKINIEEPNEDMLKQIVNKVLDDYCFKSKLNFKEISIKKKIIDDIVYATGKNHRVYNDKINNPDLAISIIDKAFAFAKYNDRGYIDEECFCEAFDYCDRIYESARKSAISMLKKEVVKSEGKSAKIINIDFIKKSR